jgi:hypothetical protein
LIFGNGPAKRTTTEQKISPGVLDPNDEVEFQGWNELELRHAVGGDDAVGTIRGQRSTEAKGEHRAA